MIDRNQTAETIPFVTCVNTEASDIPPGGVGEIMPVSGTSSLSASGYYRVRKPTQDSFGPLVFFPGGLPASQTGPGIVPGTTVGVAYDSAAGDPDVGDSIGSKTGAYLLDVDGDGYQCVAVDTANEIAYVRRKGSAAVEMIYLAHTHTTSSVLNGAFVSTSPWPPTVGNSIAQVGLGANAWSTVCRSLTGKLAYGGAFTSMTDPVNSIDYVAEYDPDADTWSQIGDGSVIDDEVYVLRTDDGKLYAGGERSTNYNTIASWNGTSWTNLGNGLFTSIFGFEFGSCFAIAFDSSNNVYAGGDFETANTSTTVNNIAKWNGSTWSALSTGTNGIVYAVAVDSSGNVYIGGNFTTAGGSAANRVAMWNGSTWSALSTGLDGPCYALAIDGDDNVYIGGDFDTAGAQTTVYNVVKWNGSTYSKLDGGLGSHSVRSLLLDGDRLWCGGAFDAGNPLGGASAVTSRDIIIWNISSGSWQAVDASFFGTSVASNYTTDLVL